MSRQQAGQLADLLRVRRLQVGRVMEQQQRARAQADGLDSSALQGGQQHLGISPRITGHTHQHRIDAAGKQLLRPLLRRQEGQLGRNHGGRGLQQRQVQGITGDAQRRFPRSATASGACRERGCDGRGDGSSSSSG